VTGFVRFCVQNILGFWVEDVAGFGLSRNFVIEAVFFAVGWIGDWVEIVVLLLFFSIWEWDGFIGLVCQFRR
jgi:hypothetical protein